MTNSTSIKELMTAIQKVQQSAGEVAKTSTGQVGTRTYKYANLNDTWDTVKALLQQNNLVVTQSPTSGNSSIGQMFTTTIYHTESEQWMTETMQMTLTKQDPQGIGSAITYYRRYMITSMLGLIPDDDNDAREQRLATSAQKARIVGAVKGAYPDLKKSDEIVQTIMNIVGKYPGNIREDEAEGAIALINAFKTESIDVAG